MYEREELERTIEELGLSTPYEELEAAFDAAPVVELTDKVWSTLDNTDYDVRTARDVKARLVDYDRDPTNYDKVLAEIRRGEWYPPLIVRLKADGRHYLVAGNTRLMVSKVNGVRPRVKIVDGVE